MRTYNFAFTDSEGWVASIEVKADSPFNGLIEATRRIRGTDDGAKLTDISSIEVEEM